MAAKAPEPTTPFPKRVAAIAHTLRKRPATLAVFQRVVAGIDPGAVASLQERYGPQAADFRVVGGIKYLDLPYWLADKIELAFRLGLDGGPPRTVLDIGMGAGHFCAACQAFGHTGIGTDIDVPMYSDICHLLGVERRISPTRLREPLPDLGRRFDLITAIKQNFNVRKWVPGGFHEHWLVEDWAFFLHDLAANHLNPGGGIYLSLNKNLTADGYVHDEAFLEWGVSRGAVTRRGQGDLWFRDIRDPAIFAVT